MRRPTYMDALTDIKDMLTETAKRHESWQHIKGDWDEGYEEGIKVGIEYANHLLERHKNRDK